MKKTGLALLFVIVSASAQAQLSFLGGLNNSNVSEKIKGEKTPTAMNQGAITGALLGIIMDNHIYFEPGVFLEMGGSKITTPQPGTFHVNMINIPLNLQYKSGTRCRSRFLVGGGPYISWLMSASNDFPAKDKFKAHNYVYNIGYDTRKDDLKKRGFGLGLNVGYQVQKHFFLRAQYQQDLANLRTVGNDKNSFKTSGISLMLGYTLANCKKGDGVFNAFKVKESNHWRGLSKGKYSTRPKYPRY